MAASHFGPEFQVFVLANRRTRSISQGFACHWAIRQSITATDRAFPKAGLGCIRLVNSTAGGGSEFGRSVSGCPGGGRKFGDFDS